MAANKTSVKKTANSNSKKSSAKSNNTSKTNKTNTNSKLSAGNNQSGSAQNKYGNVKSSDSNSAAGKSSSGALVASNPANLLPMIMPVEERALTKLGRDVNMVIDDCANSTMQNTCRVIDNMQHSSNNSYDFARQMLENSLDYFNRISDIAIDSFYCRNGEDFIELNHRLAKLNMSTNFDAINKLCKLNIKNINKNLDLASKVAEKF